MLAANSTDTCKSGSFWNYDDFGVCHKQRYLELYPVGGLLAVALVYSLVSLTYAFINRNKVKSSPRANGVSVYHPQNALDPDAKIIVQSRSIADQLRLVIELVANAIQTLLVLRLYNSQAFEKLYALNAPSFPILWLVLLAYNVALSVYRLFFRKDIAPLKASPFMQQAYIYSTLLSVYFIEFYSQKMHPAKHTSLPLYINWLLTLVSISWISLFTSPIGDEAAKLYTTRGSKPSTEPNSSLLRIMTCNWCYNMIKHSQDKTLDMEDVLDLIEEDHVYRFIGRSRKLPGNLSFFTRVTLTLYRPIFLNIFYGCTATLLKLTPTIFIQKILQFLESRDVPKGVAWLYVICLGVAYFLSDVTINQAFYQGRKLSVGVRAMIMGSVYEKAIFHRVSKEKKKKKASEDEEGNQDSTSESNSDATAVEEGDDVLEGADEFDSNNTGAVINLMSVDAFKIADFASYLHDFFTTPLIVILSIGFLYRVIGWSAFVAVAATLACLPINVILAKKLNSIQEKLMAVTDRRIEKTNEILDAIRIIKLYAWEKRFTDKVLKIRDEELRLLWLRYVFWTSNAIVFFGMPILVVISSFWCYVRIQGGTLTTSIAFTALSVFSIMRMPLNELAFIFTQLSSAMVSFKRIQIYLNSDSTTKYDQIEKGVDANGNEILGFDKATFSWGSGSEENDKSTSETGADAGADDEEDEAFKLRNVDIKFAVGDLNIIVGQTGSGKTSLLLALLGEMQKEKGKVFLPGGDRREAVVDSATDLTDTIAYCPQEAWLMNGTIKQNILFAHKYDRKRYKDVISACELSRDLEILEKGDQTLIGDKGIALSGGQKQRVSLARAMYSNSKHLILDDCLSAVDSHTAEAIYNNALCGPISHNRTIILVSHNIALTVGKAATVTVVSNGRISAFGSPAEVSASGHLGDDKLVAKNAQSAVASRVASFANLEQLAKENLDQPQMKLNKISQSNVVPPNVSGAAAGIGSTVVDEDVEEGAVEDEDRASGHVPVKTYLNFIKEMTDLKGLIIVLLLVVGVAVFEYLENYWVRLWANNSVATAPQLMQFSVTRFIPQIERLAGASSNVAARHANISSLPPIDDEVYANLKYYSIGYALIGLLLIIVSVVREMLVWYGGIRAARHIFQKLLFTVVNARTRFFDSTPNGRIVNRFTKDVEMIDQEISANLLWFMISMVDVLQVAAVVSWVTPMLVPLAIVIVYLFVLIGKAYLSAARELKRLESVTRSPIFQQFGETISGSVLIRAYGDTKRFIAENWNSIDQTHRPYFWLWVSNRWLSFCCSMLSLVIAMGGASLIVFSSDYIDAGMAGISLTFATYFGDCVLWVVRMYAECEVSMNSVERVGEYMDIEQEAAAVIPESRPPPNWPQHGSIEFKDLSLRYAEDLPMVINKVSFDIPGGKKVGVVGRTGAGKSTIITALFRLLEPATGSIKVDGIDISHLGLHDLRNGLSIIPQEPTLFKGTIRSNLDLFNEHTDTDIFQALCEANLVPAGTTPESAASIIQNHNKNTNTGGETSGEAAGNGEDDENENLNPFYDLDHEVSEGGRNLSQGQRQLLCLARAILKRPRILLLDEATASIDYETDGIIQSTIRNTFKDSTILTIAHRLRTIADYDLILVLEKGEVAQFNHPYDLLQDKEGIFYSMCEKSGELETLVKLATQAKEAAK